MKRLLIVLVLAFAGCGGGGGGGSIQAPPPAVAQKYSSSGLFEYSIDGAVELVHMARVAKAVPILFPEWPRRGVPETQRIYDLHVSIARREPACVAPIPQAWDLALARYPTLVLHDADGNHSAPAGAFLAALILATTITGISREISRKVGATSRISRQSQNTCMTQPSSRIAARNTSNTSSPTPRT